MKQAVQQQLAIEVQDWYHVGIIDASMRDTLMQRYDRHGAFLRALVKWLGLYAMLTLGGALAGFLSVLVASKTGGAIILLGFTWLCIWRGVKIANALPFGQPLTGSSLVTTGMITLYAALSLLSIDEQRLSDPISYFYPLYFVAAASIALAYYHHMRWPLLFGLLCLLHAFGASHSYAGHGTYFTDIQNEPRMAILGAAMAFFGLYHERILEETTLKPQIGFGSLYIKCGLLYHNAALLILTLREFFFGSHWLNGVAIFTFSTIAQIVIGARMKDARFTGYGIVFLSINLYTRLFEHFWNSADTAALALICGVLTFLLGILFERLSITQETATA